MQIRREEITDEKWEEMKKIARNNVCAVCGAELQVHTIPEDGTIRVGCLNREHHGWVERETWTQSLRRGEVVHPSIQAAIERKMMPKDDLGRAMNLLALRYPDSIKDPATAALFIMDCARLDLDPLIQPAEAVPIPFRSKRIVDGKEVTVVTISMIVTEDGWLSMGARGCKEEWNGPPRTMRLEEYLTTLPENKGRSLEEIEKIAKAIKMSACKDGGAWYYVAIGHSKSMTEDAVIPGWFTERDMEKAEKGRLPAFFEPGNQARVRAIKKWMRHVYPECRQKMIDITHEWYERAEGIKAAQEYIDAEYSFISSPEGKEKAGEQEKSEGGGRGETAQTAFASPKGKVRKTKQPPSATAAEPEPNLEGEGFHIDLEWLNETLKLLKWTEDTAKTFLAGSFKVDTQGKLTDVIALLSREQAEIFSRELQKRAAKVQPELFNK